MDIRAEIYEAIQNPHNTSIQDLIHPYRNSPYPLSQIDTFVRYPHEYTWRTEDGSIGWIDYNKLQDAVSEAVPAYRSIPEDEGKRIFEEAFDRKAAIHYKHEWSTVGTLGQLKVIIGEQPLAVAANQKTGEVMAEHVTRTIRQSYMYALMDWGPGELGTTSKILDRIPSEYLNSMTFILVDVMENALKASTEKLMSQYGIRRENIETVEAFLQDIEKLPELKHYEGMVDGIVSGACVHQNRRFEPIFRHSHRLLSQGGALFYWDWLHHLWKAPRVKAGFNLSSDEAINGAREMARIWVGLHGYGKPPGEQGLTPLQERVMLDFDATVYNDGFNFHQWMERNLVGVQPNKNTRTAYRSAEGHREPEIPEKIIKNIFGNAECHRFPPTDILHGFYARKEPETIEI